MCPMPGASFDGTVAQQQRAALKASLKQQLKAQSPGSTAAGSFNSSTSPKTATPWSFVGTTSPTSPVRSLVVFPAEVGPEQATNFSKDRILAEVLHMPEIALAAWKVQKSVPPSDNGFVRPSAHRRASAAPPPGAAAAPLAVPAAVVKPASLAPVAVGVKPPAAAHGALTAQLPLATKVQPTAQLPMASKAPVTKAAAASPTAAAPVRRQTEPAIPAVSSGKQLSLDGVQKREPGYYGSGSDSDHGYDDASSDGGDSSSGPSTGFVQMPIDGLGMVSPKGSPGSSWRKTSFSTSQISDMTRGFFRATFGRKANAEVDAKNLVVFGDLQPIDKRGTVCVDQDAVDIASPSSSAGRRRSSLTGGTGSRRSVGSNASGSGGEVVITMPAGTLLGEGQYGLVWRAKSAKTGTWFAVKSVKPRHVDSELTARELQIVRLVNAHPHPCLVRLFQVLTFDDDTLCALVMEYCDGGDLQQLVRRRRRAATNKEAHYIAPKTATRWLAQVFLGLEYLHLQMGILFRDLKPGNVVIGVEGTAKICDFGLGRCGLQSDGAWTFGFPAGSPGYTAPEILDQDEYDYTADLYSFGCVTWVVLTGGMVDRPEPAPPYSSDDEDWELLEKCLLCEPETYASEPLDQVPRDFILDLCRRHPEDRLSHGDIREHPFFEDLRLPAPGVDDALDKWLASAAAFSRGHASSMCASSSVPSRTTA